MNRDDYDKRFEAEKRFKKMIYTRRMKVTDFFRVKVLDEPNENAMTGDSVFIRRDKSFQGLVNHLYQRICLLLSFYNLSPILYHVILAIDPADDRIVGVVWARGTRIGKSLIGVFVQPSHRRKGIGTQLYYALLELADSEKLTLYSIDYSDNYSVAMLKKMGFEHVKTLEKVVRYPR